MPDSRDASRWWVDETDHRWAEPVLGIYFHLIAVCQACGLRICVGCDEKRTLTNYRACAEAGSARR